MQYVLQGISADVVHYMKRTFLSKLDIVLGLCMFVSLGVYEGSFMRVSFVLFWT